MAVTAISLTRVSHNQQTIALQESVRGNTLSMFLEQNRLASGNRLNAPSEDPVTAFRAMQLSEILESQDQILRNISHADSILSATDTAIGEINSLLTDAHNIALTMINGTTSSEERQAEAQLILGIINELVSVGNRSYRDIQLFGGQRTQTVPFTQRYGVAEYRGDLGSLTTRVDVNQSSAFNLTGAELFGALSGGVRGWADLNPALEDDTRLADVNGAAGRGIQLGTIRVSLSLPATSFLVDLTRADTAGDVIDLINNAAEQAGLTVGPGGVFNASFNAGLSGYQIDVGAGTVTVSDLGEGVTARDLGIRASGASIVGADLNTKVTGMTRVSALFGGAGAALGSIRIQNGALSADVDLSGATTVQEILNTINTAGVEVIARINGSANGIEVLNPVSGSRMTIGELGGNTAEVLGIRSLHAGTLLGDLNQGKGVPTLQGRSDLAIQAKNGTRFEVILGGCRTIGDVLGRINAAAATAGVAVTADLADVGNGIRITDSTGGAGELVISRVNMSYAINALGLDKRTTGNAIIGDDVNGQVPNSVFTALQDLYDGLMHDDTTKIGDAASRLEGFMRSASRLQGQVGARSKAMGTRLQFTEDAVVSTRAMLSQVKDLDYTEAITKFQQAQMALQANLMTGSRLMQISLLNYL
ncbi:MAG TPA: flagellar hook-associated protein FlgL [Phycisphaerae bacterium]|nr:flagellar hook-associated protein FlgL [Phycisphaerae bacterium]